MATGFARLGTPVDAETQRWVLFLDELPMPKRPDASPTARDRELFMTGLPSTIDSEDELRDWLRDWLGTGEQRIQAAHFLRDRTWGSTNGKAYVTFGDHEMAAAFLEQDGGATSSWSEAERANQRSKSAYGIDIHAAFTEQDGSIVQSIKTQCGVQDLWALSGTQRPPSGPEVPVQTAQQLHFVAECTAEDFEDVQSALGFALERFHVWIASRLKRLQATVIRPVSTRPQLPVSRYARNLERIKRGEAPRGNAKPSKKNAHCLRWNPATGQYEEDDIPDDLQEIMGIKEVGVVTVKEEPGDWAWVKEPVSETIVKAQPDPTAGSRNGLAGVVVPPPLRGKDASAWRTRAQRFGATKQELVEEPSVCMRQRKTSANYGAPAAPIAQHQEAVQRQRIGAYIGRELDQLAKRASQGSHVSNVVSAAQEQQGALECGEALVLKGRQLAQQGERAQALEKYQEGIQFLLDATKQDHGRPEELAEWRLKTNTYLSEIEVLSAQLGKAAGVSAAASQIEEDAELRRRIGDCEATMRDALALEELGLIKEAEKTHNAGLLAFVEMVQDLGRQTASAEALQSKISFCLAGAVSLGQQVERSGMLVRVLPGGRLGVSTTSGSPATTVHQHRGVVVKPRPSQAPGLLAQCLHGDVPDELKNGRTRSRSNPRSDPNGPIPKASLLRTMSADGWQRFA